jgi:hypothetical protein
MTPLLCWLLTTSAAATLLDLKQEDTVCKTKTAASFHRHAHHLPTKWTARYSRAAAPDRPGRYLELWGRFGLLNNRLRCLANAVGFAARADASLVLSGPWELFADAAIDTDWLIESRIADVVIVDRDHAWPPSEYFANRTVRLSCADAFYCGGVCERGKGARDVKKRWPGVNWRALRAGGQRIETRSPGLYASHKEPALCGYAALAPQSRIREAALNWRAPASFIIGHHQRLETTVTREPVAQMCHKAAALLKGAFYGKVCDGKARPVDIADGGKVLLASDKFLKDVHGAWAADQRVVLASTPAELTASEATSYKGPSAMFNTRLGEALYAPGFRGGPRARRAALQTQVAPVLFDMLLLAARTGRFWPTPGSTMSQTVCFWRAAWGLDGAASITSCEDICVAP